MISQNGDKMIYYGRQDINENDITIELNGINQTIIHIKDIIEWD